eukprot:scaffold21164_cov54-Attheya_sp.AAC.2
MAALFTSVSATTNGEDTSPIQSLNIMTTVFGVISDVFNTPSVNKQFDGIKLELEVASLERKLQFAIVVIP